MILIHWIKFLILVLKNVKEVNYHDLVHLVSQAVVVLEIYADISLRTSLFKQSATFLQGQSLFDFCGFWFVRLPKVALPNAKCFV